MRLISKISRHQRCKRARQSRAHVAHALLEVSHEARAACVALREPKALLLAERRHALADRCPESGPALQDGVHLGLQRTQFFATPLVNLIGRHARGRRCAQRPCVVLIALRQLPHARIAGCTPAMRFQLGDLAVERRRDFVCCDLRALPA